MSTSPAPFISQEEYIERELAADTRHEYIHGEMAAMAGGSLRHAMIAANIAAALVTRLRGRCAVFSSDARVCVQWGELITYPDVTVLCGPPRVDDRLRDTLLNPSFVVEVLSPSTRNHDRGEKSRLYRLVPSLSEYLLVEQMPIEVEHYRRLPNGHWEIATIRERDAIFTLESLGCELPVAEIYSGLELLDAPRP